ncbi:hypothetical protein pb186bvf_020380 [Paramecium bursaria]
MYSRITTDSRRESSFLKSSLNSSLLESEQGPSRRSFLGRESIDRREDTITGLQKANDLLKRQSYQNMVELLQVNNEGQITTQRNEIFKLKMQVEELTRKLEKAEKVVRDSEVIIQQKNKQIETLDRDKSALMIANQNLENQVRDKDQKVQTITEQLGVFKSKQEHNGYIINDKDSKIEQLQHEVNKLHEYVDQQTYLNNKIYIDEIDTWKKKFFEMNREFKQCKEQLMLAQAEMESACITRDSVVSKARVNIIIILHRILQ